MNTELLNELNNAVDQFTGTVGALNKIQTINDGMVATMNEMHSCEEKLLESCKTIEKSANNVNEQAASFSESNEALRISLGKDVRDLADKVTSYTSSTISSINELRIQDSNNSREIRESINDMKSNVGVLETNISNKMNQIEEVLSLISEKQTQNKRILLIAFGLATIGLVLAVIGLFV